MRSEREIWDKVLELERKADSLALEAAVSAEARAHRRQYQMLAQALRWALGVTESLV